MKTITLSMATVGLLTMASCQNIKEEKNDPKVISQQAIEVHDEIMPQISSFDKHSILIDSLLDNLAGMQNSNNALDTAATRRDLTQLKSDLESATDKMMVWMKEYQPDSADATYQKAEVERISNLRTEFETVSKSAEKVLTPFNK
ncbi:transposase [Sphingobacterium bambusae]|uniref:Transposase n=1 Tax=Sphingobacterium bambusae TaxID=662858 RepID=A0ABW6BQC0_9SPHI|nr:transposase [Sphingobacterium bambusae]WPL47843.1 transposase [Sphingobacterium bambusae]